MTSSASRPAGRTSRRRRPTRVPGPQLLYGEPDLTLKVVRDLFTEDFAKLVIEGDDAWDTVHGYVESVAPDLAERLERFERGATGGDVFATYRIDEQIHKGLDRKVWLPSGGSLIIDRTEAMTVVDVNTGKFTGSGGNLEETVTKNNLEAAEEIVRQLRLRDIGGIIVVDFIDMVLESNRDLVVRRLVECLGRDRTRHQVAEVTSLGLVQMTRKRIGTGLVEAFSENCEACHGRGVVIKDQPVDPDARSDDGEGRRRAAATAAAVVARRRRRLRRATEQSAPAPSPKDVAAMARQDRANAAAADEASAANAADAVADSADDAPATPETESPKGRSRGGARGGRGVDGPDRRGRSRVGRARRAGRAGRSRPSAEKVAEAPRAEAPPVQATARRAARPAATRDRAGSTSRLPSRP